jgi:hypothetical protein
MQSPYQPQAYEDTSLLALDLAFVATLATLKANDPFRDWDKDDALKAALAKTLFVLAAAGVSDPDELEKRSLIVMSQPQSGTQSARPAISPNLRAQVRQRRAETFGRKTR